MQACEAVGGGAAGATFAAALNFFAAAQCLLQEPWPPHATVQNGSAFDVIVVGGGTAGAALAARLSELPGRSVLLLEAGGDPPVESIIPGFRDSMKNSPVDWNFTTVDDKMSSQALRGGAQRQPRGKMLGGSGSINDMIYSRGSPVDYEEWAARVGDQWSWRNVLEYFKKTEHLTDERILADPELARMHGFGGEIEVTGTFESTLATDKFLEAFEELGFPIVKDMTNPEVIGAGRFSHTMRGGRRASSATAMLNNAKYRDNLYVLKNALVTKILIENKRAYGVQVVMNEEFFYFYGKKEIVLSAGTFNTPKLLLLSGIGPAPHLNEMGIEVKLDLPVGENLHDHVMVLTYLEADEGTCRALPPQRHLDALRYLLDGAGRYGASSDLAAYVSYDASAANVPDFAFYPTCMPRNNDFYEPCTNVLGFKSEICEKLAAINKEKELLTIAVVNLKPKSRGRVRLRSRDPFDPPLIYAGTFSDEEDLLHFPAAMRTARALANTTYFRRRNARVVRLPVGCAGGGRGEAALRCEARALATSAWHAAGTAALGGVVDARLRVRGARALRVADASVMPALVRGNTNAPVLMIAEKAAHYIKQSLAVA